MALGADVAEAAGSSVGNAGLGGVSAQFGESFPEVAPPAVPGATMATRTCHQAIAYNSTGSTSELTWIWATGADSVWNPSPNGAVMCPLEIPVGSRLVRIDYYGYRATVGTQTWPLIRFDSTTGLSTVPTSSCRRRPQG